MALFSLLLNPNFPLLPSKFTHPRLPKFTPFKPLICHNSVDLGSPLSNVGDYKLSWKDELRNAYPNEILDWESEEKLQELVDRRCVDNVRMLIVDAVQNAKAGHPGMALGGGRWPVEEAVERRRVAGGGGGERKRRRRLEDLGGLED